MRWISRFFLIMAIAMVMAVTIFWVRSYGWADRFSLNLSNTRQISMVSYRGYLYFAATRLIPIDSADVSFMTEGGFHSTTADTPGLDADQLQPKLLIFRCLGLAASFGSFYCFGMPSWLMLIVLGVPTSAWVMRRRQRRRIAQGRGFEVRPEM